MTDETTTATAEPTERAPEAPRADRPARPAKAPAKPKRKRGTVVTDPVADLLTRIRNGVSARHDTVTIPPSKLKREVARILKEEGFVSAVDDSEAGIVVRLKYVGKTPAISGIRRISKPGLRIYKGKDEMPRVLGGLGISIVSTSGGVMTGREAARRGLGGEILAHVW